MRYWVKNSCWRRVALILGGLDGASIPLADNACPIASERHHAACCEVLPNLCGRCFTNALNVVRLNSSL